MPKNRYRVMRPFLSARGRLAPDMMAMTASAQASFDFSGERDMAEKLRVALAIQPAVAALYANSPVVDGREIGWKSYRVAVWAETDPARCGLLPFAFEPGFEDRAYRSYVEWALDVPMIFLRRRGGYLDPGGRTFRALLEGALPGERPTLSDWEDHLTTLFPDVRVKGVVEVRGTDACDLRMTQALLAFWKGILYDRAARAAAWDVVKGFTRRRAARLHGGGRAPRPRRRRAGRAAHRRDRARPRRRRLGRALPAALLRAAGRRRAGVARAPRGASPYGALARGRRPRRLPPRRAARPRRARSLRVSALPGRVRSRPRAGRGGPRGHLFARPPAG